MNSVTLHGELAVAYPEGFHVMDSEEAKRVFLEDSPDRWGIWDTDRHIIMAVVWHESNKLAAKLAGLKGLAERIEKKASKAYRDKGYRCLGFRQATVCGHETCTLEFEYAIDEVQQAAQVDVFKHGACCYSVYSFVRKENEAEAKAVVQGVLDGMALR